MKVGVISDTHNFLSAAVFEKFKGVDRIFHAGDIVSEDILIELETIAPVIAVHGNSDFYPLTSRLPSHKVLTLHSVNFAIVHIIGNKHNFLSYIEKMHPSFKPDVVIYGHTHLMHYEKMYDVHFVNPGCAGNSRCLGQKTAAIIEWNSREDLKVDFVGLGETDT